MMNSLSETRRHFHMYPELSFQEEKTAVFIKNWLSNKHILFQDGYAGHGIVITIERENPDGKYLYFRADMDALPIQEESDYPYRSKVDGVMHACGHDVHMTCLLGAIEEVYANRQMLPVSVKFIFQPGEEKLPGGATLMLRDRAVIPEEALGIIALHVYPELEAGKVGFGSGAYMASSDEIYIDVIGKGGHGAMPQNCIDPILIAARIIEDSQSLISKNKNPFTPSVLTFGKIYSHGGATNVIPDIVSLEGTFRSMDENWRYTLHTQLEQLVKSIAQGAGGEASVNIIKGYPVLINNEALTDKCKKIAANKLGTKNIIELKPRMTSEDFAWYAQKIPACFFRLGTRNPNNDNIVNLHTPFFDVDESCLLIGSQLLAAIAFNY